MVFGHNSNLKLGSNTFHVQTEDRGATHAMIDTTVYYQGRVLHRRTNNYHDLLPMNEENQQKLKVRVDEQHRTVLDAIRSGELHMAVPQPTSASANAAPGHSHPAGANSEMPAGHCRSSTEGRGSSKTPGHASRRGQRGRRSEHCGR